MRWFKFNRSSNPEDIQDSGSDDFKEVYSGVKDNLGKEKVILSKTQKEQEKIAKEIYKSQTKRYSGFSLPFGNLIGGFIIIIVGVTLFPTIQDSITEASLNQTGMNVTGAASTVLDLTTMFFIFAIVTAGIAIAAQGLRSAGMFD